MAYLINGRRFRLIVLGAGFSRAAGLPLGQQLWHEVRQHIRRHPFSLKHYESDVKRYLRYKSDCPGPKITRRTMNFEDFLRYLDIEHFLAVRGKDTWSTAGNETTVAIKTVIGKILADKTPTTAAIPPLYLEFARGLLPDDIILTFNYDTLLERALDAVGKPYRLFPTRYESTDDSGGVADTSKDEVIVLKLHGSIDWFDRTTHESLTRIRQKHGLSGGPPHPVFSHIRDLGVTRLIKGPRPRGNPLNKIYRVKNIAQLYKNLDSKLLSATPWILAPSAAKLVYSEPFRDFWFGIGAAGIQNYGMSVIGYSLPDQDEYARQILFSMVKNYQALQCKADRIGGLKKTPLTMVNLFNDAGETMRFKNRFRFVDWRRAVLCKEGLNANSVAKVIAFD